MLSNPLLLGSRLSYRWVGTPRERYLPAFGFAPGGPRNIQCHCGYPNTGSSWTRLVAFANALDTKNRSFFSVLPWRVVSL